MMIGHDAQNLVIGISSLLERRCEPDIPDSYIIRCDYVDSVIEAGGFPLMIPCHPHKKVLDDYLNNIDGIVFVGGPDWPAEFYNESNMPENKSGERLNSESDLYLMRESLSRKIPMLGICAGSQLLSIACGGKLIQHIDNVKQHNDFKAMHKVKLTGNGRILRSFIDGNEFLTNTEHHQAIDPEKPGKDLIISAVAEDGTVEVIEGTGNVFRLGVQFHIERPNNGNLRELIFKNFINKVERNQKKGK